MNGPSAEKLQPIETFDKKETLVSEMLRVTRDLTFVVSHETECLARAKWLDMHQLNPQKSSLALRYSALSHVLRDVPAEALASDTDMAELKVAAATLDHTVRENARRLKIHMDANRRVAEIVANAAKNATTPCFAYGNGKPGPRARYGTQSPPVSVIKVL